MHELWMGCGIGLALSTVHVSQRERVHVMSVLLCYRRLDYFVVSERLVKDVCDCVIRNEVYGSDHCPLVLSIADPTPSDTPTTSDPAPKAETTPTSDDTSAPSTNES